MIVKNNQKKAREEEQNLQIPLTTLYFVHV